MFGRSQFANAARADVEASASRLMTRLGLADALAKKCEDLSKGMLQRVQFVAAIINQPDLLILDEPLGGLKRVFVSRMLEWLDAGWQLGEFSSTVGRC